MTVGEKIKHLRLEAGLSQAQLADALCVSRAAVAKWENDNGIPDVGNLKALADFFHIDVDVLLDEENDLSDQTKRKVEAVSYCGKDCSACTQREPEDCPGCKLGPAKNYITYCAIAKCCRRNSQSACDACTRSAHCGTLQNRDDMPRLRVSAEKAELAKKAALRVQSAFLGKWIWVHFWLFVPSILTGLLIASQIAEKMPMLRVIGYALSIAISVTEGLILRYISRYEPMFKIAGNCVLALACADLFVLLITGTMEALGWKYIWLVPEIILGMVCSYHEMHGYARILLSIDFELSEKWEKLWKFYLVSFGIVLVAILLLKLLRTLAMIALGIGLAGSIVVGILVLIYRYKTAKAFRDYC